MSTSVVLMNKVNTPSYSLTSAALLRRLSHCVCVWMVCVLLRKFGGLTALKLFSLETKAACLHVVSSPFGAVMLLCCLVMAVW